MLVFCAFQIRTQDNEKENDQITLRLASLAANGGVIVISFLRSPNGNFVALVYFITWQV